MQEGFPLFRIIGLMACSGLVAGSLWLPGRSLAQNAPPFPGGAGPRSTATSDVARQRVRDYLSKADRAFKNGDRAEATRMALAADRLARESNVTFGPNELSPGALLAQIQGLAPAAAQSTPAQMPTISPQTPAGAPQGTPQASTAGSPSGHHRRVQTMLRAAESDIRAGRGAEALDKARRAEAYAAEHGVEFGVVDLRPEHVVSLVRRQFPDAANAAGPIQQVAHTAPATSAPAAAPPSDPALAKQQAMELLAAARQKIDQGYFDEARSLVLQAREYDSVVSYGVFDDRPEHVLRDLERQSRTNIIAGSSTGSAGGNADPRREQALALMRESQQALVNGQLDLAKQLAEQAQEIGATFLLSDPRPEVLLQDIETYRASMGIAPASGVQQATGFTPSAPVNTEDAKGQALAHLQAARAAMQQGQFDVAEQHAREAAQFDVAYGLLEDRPDRVMADISRLAQNGIQQVSNSTGSVSGAMANEKQLAQQLLGQARAALQAGDVDSARQFAMQADQLEVAYDLLEDRPDSLLAEIEQLAAAAAPGAGQLPGRGQAMAAAPRRDPFVVPPGATAADLYQIGQQALRSGDREGAREAFLAAYQSGETLDPVRQQRLQDYLTELAAPSGIRQASNEQVSGDLGGDRTTEILSATTQRREIRADRLQTQVLEAVYRAEKLRDKQPEKALELLTQTSAEINAAQIGDQEKARLLASVESTASSIEAYMEQRRPLIELERRNAEVRSAIARERDTKIRIEQELAKLTDNFNDLMEQGRSAEAHHIARQAKELDPKNPVVVQMFYQSLFAGRNDDNKRLRAAKEETFWRTLQDAEWSLAHNISDDHPMDMGKNWLDIIERRKGTPTDMQEHSEEELRVREALEKPVSLHFQDEPLASVMEHVNATQLINVVVDEAGLLETGTTASTPITINVDGIRLKSALNLILAPLDLSYTIEDEVLKITSRLRQQGDLKPVVYPVADLIVPVSVESPMSQFQPGTGFGQPFKTSQPSSAAAPNMGIGFGQVQDPLNAAFPTVGGGTGVDGQDESRLNNYDFQSLMGLITQTIEPESWDEFGGQATIAEHGSTLSLVIRQTQRVHQEIADLLTQLRRLQDLQVTIEVRFITVSDRFFERIGIDFDFNVQDSVGGPIVNDDFSVVAPFGTTDTNFGAAGATGQQQQQGQQQQGQQNQQGTTTGGNAPFGAGPSLNLQGRDSWPGRTIVGMVSENAFSNDLDIPFRQGSFGLGVPAFGGFNADAGISFGMAILSDIEAFLFVNAAQGDTRSNIMFAPKITLFNGQLGTLISALQRPFVVSVTPVVGIDAVGFQPDIQVINDGAQLFVRAVISADRRYVRLAVSPVFNNVTDVFTFSFVGGGGNIGLGGNQGQAGVGGGQQGVSGALGGQGGQQQQGQQQQGQQGAGGLVTIQQPVVDTVQVSTVVSVPDGGTVLLGGVKRLRENRTMAGVPIMNKIPYVSRLFKNTGVGRETDSLLLMVTPRIIIAEEEEELLGIPN